MLIQNAYDFYFTIDVGQAIKQNLKKIESNQQLIYLRCDDGDDNQVQCFFFFFKICTNVQCVYVHI